ncbi:MAG: DUF3341 domain-containing protein [Polyangia bacterium]
MTVTHTAVFGLFNTRAQVESAIIRLEQEGFRHADISVLFPDTKGTSEFAHEANTKAPEGAAGGAGAGAIVGGTLGLLAGIGLLAIPGLGPLIAAGPIMAALAGMGVGGAVGGLVGALVGMGIPEIEAKRYEGLIKEGRILASVHSGTSEATKKAKSVLEACGATHVSSTGESKGDIHTTM